MTASGVPDDQPLTDAAASGADVAPGMVASSPQVSAQMSRHPRKDTEPEVALRRVLFARGLRYRVHLPVPGWRRRTIDVAFPGVRLAVFVDGCFWHGCPEHGEIPASNREWWRRKLDGNRRRDDETSEHLVSLGWEVLRFWCHEDVTVMAEAVAASVEARRALAASPIADRGRRSQIDGR
jgi:DNA mismatch endonuclease (patch repair protein)